MVGCAGQGAPPPSATSIPWAPGYLTVNRKDEADRWAKDVVRRQKVEVYMTAICSPDGWWAQMDKQWTQDQADLWTLLWRFEPIPNTPASTSGNAITGDIGALLGSLIGSAAKGALLVPKPKAALPPGLPPC